MWSDFRAQALDLKVALAGGEAWTLTWVSRLGVPMLLPLQRYEWLCQCQLIHPDLDRQPTLPPPACSSRTSMKISSGGQRFGLLVFTAVF